MRLRNRFPLLAVVALTWSGTGGVPGAAQMKPDLSGKWVLDLRSRDDTESKILGGAGEDKTRGMTHLERARNLDQLVQLARAIEQIEIEQSPDDLKIYDRDDNVRIYYLDGHERVRETPWGARVNLVGRWDGPQISVRTTGGKSEKSTRPSVSRTVLRHCRPPH
jgi:hypothetical protein